MDAARGYSLLVDVRMVRVEPRYLVSVIMVYIKELTLIRPHFLFYFKLP